MENENVETNEELNNNKVEDNVEELNASQTSDDVVEEKTEEESFKDKYFYIAAEMQNMQRRFDKEKENLLKYGSEKILRDMLDVVDNFERTLGFIETDEDEKVKNIAVGIDMIAKQFVEALGKHGLKKVEAMGEIFDPNFHEALAQQPADDKKEMEIIQVHQTGYTLNERLIRPAKVVVVKNS
jgi:molecular chaperone GrpE